MNKNVLIFGLSLILIAVVIVAGLRGRLPTTLQLAQRLATPVPTPSKTGTFVDQLVGKFVFMNEGKLYEFVFPTRIVQQIAGVSDNVIDQFPGIKPVWSLDGDLFAFGVSDTQIAVVRYTTGDKIALLTLPNALDLSKPVTLSLAPTNDALAVHNGSSLSVFMTADAARIYNETNCDLPRWLGDGTLVASCDHDGKEGIYHFLFDSTSSMKLVKDASSGNSLINTYDDMSVIVKRGNTYSIMDMNGKISTLSKDKLKLISSEEALKYPESALARRIEENKKTEPIDELSVASDNSFVVFHTHKGLWVVDVQLKHDPYLLTSGQLPTVRPY